MYYGWFISSLGMYCFFAITKVIPPSDQGKMNGLQPKWLRQLKCSLKLVYVELLNFLTFLHLIEFTWNGKFRINIILIKKSS